MQHIWIDTDLSVGMKRYHKAGYSDVDDGYALLQLFKAEQVQIHGISAVFGNTRIDDAFRLCNYMVDHFAPSNIPVYKGAGEAIKLESAQSNEAVDALAQALRKQKLRIMAIGPATNIGLLCLCYPELVSQIEEVVLVAGRRKESDHFTIGTRGASAPDLNFDLDNDAFRLMFQHKVPLVFCPFEISNKVWLGEADLLKMDKGDAGTQWLATHSRNWLNQWLEMGEDGFNPFDVLASHYLIRPQDIICEALNARLEIHPKDDLDPLDKHHFKSYLLCDRQIGYPVKYCFDVVENYHEALMNSLLK